MSTRVITIKELRALRGYFGPPLRLKMKIAFTNFFTIAQVQKPGINLTFTVDMVTKMATEIG